MLATLCENRHLELRLELVDDVMLHTSKEPLHPECVFRLRVQQGDDILAGRLEGEHGATLNELAVGCLDILYRKGFMR